MARDAIERHDEDAHEKGPSEPQATGLRDHVAAALRWLRLGEAGTRGNRIRMQLARAADARARGVLLGTPDAAKNEPGAARPDKLAPTASAAQASDIRPTGGTAESAERSGMSARAREILAKIGFLETALAQMEETGRYRIHILSCLQDPAIAPSALDPQAHRAFLEDPACDPAAVRNDRIMLESFLRQTPTLTFDGRWNAHPRHREFWNIVRLYLQDPRMEEFLRSDAACVARLRKEFHRVVWHDRRPEAIAWLRRNDAVDYVNQKLSVFHGGFPISLPRS